MNHLDSLKSVTTVVADTGDIEAMITYKPQDATTNPSLLLKASQLPRYRDLVDEALSHAAQKARAGAEQTALFTDKLAVNFGCEILKIIPGRVSTEVDATLSFDTRSTIDKARGLIALYEAQHIDRERILIKVGSTWEGIRAAEQLEREGIHCNLTLLFSFAQAVACAEAGVTLVSPFVGRIYDYYVKAGGGEDIPIEADPGVASVTRIYNYYKRHGYQTQVMGASFRKVTQVEQLAGCDLLTISPGLLSELMERQGDLPVMLSRENAQTAGEDRLDMNEKAFRWRHNSDAMAVEKLSDGIRRFDADARKLEAYAQGLVNQAA